MSRERGSLAAALGATALIALFALEYIAVGAAMPTVAEDLDGFGLYNLAFGATVAASIVGMVLGGWWSDRSGPRPVVLTGASTFTAGLVVAGLSTDMGVFCAGRGLQGLGTGMCTVALYVVIAQKVPDERRPAVFSWLAAAWVLPGLAGPLLTGWVVERFTWHWVFLGVAPFVLVALAVLLPALRGTGPAGQASHLSPMILGWAVLAAVAVGALNLSGESVEGVEWIVGAGLLVVLLLAAQRLLPVGTLRMARGLPSVMGVRAALGGSFVAAEAYLPLLLQREHGYSPAQAGGVLAAASVMWALGSAVQGRLPSAVDRYRLMVRGTALFTVLMLAMTAGVWWSWPGWLLIGLYGLATLGVGLAYPTTTLLTLRLSPADRVGRNSSSLQLGEAITSALALALTGVVFGFTFAADQHLAFTATLLVAIAVGALSILSAVRARPGVSAGARAEEPRPAR